MNRMIAAALIAGTIASSGNAHAGQVSMPKKGTFEFVFCVVDQARTLNSSDHGKAARTATSTNPDVQDQKYFVSHYQGIASARTDPPGRPFDRTSGVCYGTYMFLNGQHRGLGMCEIVDMDGDVFWMEYTDAPDGSGGTYTSPWGTGKYAGMTLKGEYRVEAWPTAKDAAFQV
ncbi:MAG: hypothetical protein AB7F99_20455, partial [Vicinamibacterales bacterium]